ncbi:hypothetical protein Tco_0503696 [Tanacetum coccineum]
MHYYFLRSPIKCNQCTVGTALSSSSKDHTHQSNDVQIHPVQALETSSVVTESSGTESENSSLETTFSRSENEHTSFNKESSSSEGNDADADIGPSYDNDTMTEYAFFASLINNLKCDVDKCNEINREAQQPNALLTNELVRYKEKEKHFAKETSK